MVLEIAGAPDDVERFLAAIRPFGIQEMMRTGRIAMTRGACERTAANDGNGAGETTLSGPLARTTDHIA